ncbi:MAG: c-type cytochrome [Gammaproteobacteria bacterium]|jgi:cytochrome c peroxidase|nr:c-type cytochrome [Gammaproteobacteria bacterium]MBT4145953.1 c-type cytochrome [Gammaproteobacteria bacterium]MBT5223651.1 c-type cytochrome [Gammaproteobacteria bacterium]MBT5824566.1 c-type cytochrome [Gammaproteobacteria bacterium]MBT6420778.1 c-type cytochrome [Gammaproteobacteria bacterium]
MKTYGIALLFFLHTAVLNADTIKVDTKLGLPVLSIPANNQQSAEKIALGRQLFNDKRLSQDGSISCASCHNQDRAFTDGQKVAVGIRQQTGFRNAPTVVNAAFYQTLFLDGRAGSLEDQALGPLLNPIEHGLRSQQEIVEIVAQAPGYQQQFTRIFNSGKITAVQIAQAIASFERTLIAGNSAFDRYLFGRDRQALTQSEARGMRLFRRKGNCANCHEISGKDALFMDNRFYNLGVGFAKVNPQIPEFVQALRVGEGASDFSFSAAQRAELGRFNVTQIIADIGKFKTPTLRNIALTAPYMHDGSINSLEEVVEYYDKGGEKTLFLDPAIFPLHLTAHEKQDLVAFLKALTSAAPILVR